MKSIFCCRSSTNKETSDYLSSSNLVLPFSRMQSRTKNAMNATKELLLYKKGLDISSFDLTNSFNTSSLIEIIKVLLSANHCLMLLKDHSGTFLGGYGSNQNGQLGFTVKSNQDNLYPHPKNIAIDQLKNQNIIDIAIGDSFSLILIEDLFTHLKKLIKLSLTQEEAFTLINNSNSALSPVKEEKFKHDLSSIIKIYSDEQRTILLSKDNSLFIKGTLFNLDIHISYKLFKHFDSEIKDIAFGNNHCLVLLRDNILIAFGHNEFGELGLDSTNPEFFNLHTGFGSNLMIRKIVCGKRHSLALCENGELYSFGDNSENQCSGNEKYVNSPYLIPFKQKISINNAYCGGNYSLAKTSKGEIYCWGNCNFLFENEYGNDERICEPKEITTLKLKNIQEVYPGIDQILFYNETLNK